MGSKFNIEPNKLLEVLKATVIKSTDKHDVTNEEVAAFVIVANQYGLNPFTREIHAFAGRGGGIVPIVGVDGWAHIVNDNPLFDGCTFQDVQDEKYGSGIKCCMHVKGRSHPVEVTEWLTECSRATDPWKGMPRRMLRHKAFMQAARLCFGLSGIYDEDEARDIIKVHAVESEMVETNGKSRTDALADRIEKQVSKKSNPAPEPTAQDPGASGQQFQDVPSSMSDVTATSAQPSPIANQLRESIISEIEKKIEQAETQNDFGEVGALMMANHDDIGNEVYGKLEKFFQERYKAKLKAGKSKVGK